jgi:molecular chaperone GrpE (heat shock protein)
MSKKDNKKTDYKAVAEELATENAALQEQVLRERADAENMRRRHQEELQRLRTIRHAMVKVTNG